MGNKEYENLRNTIIDAIESLENYRDELSDIEMNLYYQLKNVQHTIENII